MGVTTYIPKAEQEAILESNRHRKPADMGWMEYLNDKLTPIMEGIGAGASSATRAIGPLKPAFDAVAHPAAAAIRTHVFGQPTTAEENEKRITEREKANPGASEAGYKAGSIGRDAYLAANPYTRALVAADRMRTLAFGSGSGVVSQGFDEYDRAVNQNKPVEPLDVGERLTGAMVGGGVGAMTGQQAAKYNPFNSNVNRIPGRPLDADQLTALARAEQLAHANRDTAPDLAQLMRLSGDERMGTRAADVEGMYRKAKPVIISEADIAKHAAPDGGNRLTGRLTSPVKEGSAQVAPEVLQQLDKRNVPGGFNAQIERAASDLGTSQLVLERILNQSQRGPRVDAVTPPAGAIPQRTTNERNRLYSQAVEAERRQPNNTYLTEPEGKRQVGDPNQMRFWDAALERLPPQDRAILEDVLGSIRGARPGQPGSAVGSGPPKVGPAIQARTRAQRALDEYGDVQKSIGESYPYKPGELPTLNITPPAISPLKFGIGLTNPSGWASTATTKAFKDPTTAGRDIGRMSPQEFWAALALGQAGAHGAAAVVEGQRKHRR